MTTEEEAIETTRRAIEECKALLPTQDEQNVHINRCPGVWPGFIFATRGQTIIYCGPLKGMPEWVNVEGNEIFMSPRDVGALAAHCEEIHVYGGTLQ